MPPAHVPLAEIARPRQVAGEAPRRWFHSPDMDLIVWLAADGSPAAFQLCYDTSGNEKALTWTPEGGHRHATIDTGETRPGRPKATPVLAAGSGWNRAALARQFAQAASRLPEPIARFVRERL